MLNFLTKNFFQKHIGISTFIFIITIVSKIKNKPGIIYFDESLIYYCQDIIFPLGIFFRKHAMLKFNCNTVKFYSTSLYYTAITPDVL